MNLANARAAAAPPNLWCLDRAGSLPADDLQGHVAEG